MRDQLISRIPARTGVDRWQMEKRAKGDRATTVHSSYLLVLFSCLVKSYFNFLL